MSNVRINILELNGGVDGTVKGSDVYPAVDTTDFSQASDGTTKRYSIVELFNFVVGGLGIYTYPACKVATTANLTALYDNGMSGVNATLLNTGLFAPLLIDGITLELGDVVLVKNQTNGAENGIYYVSVVGTALIPWQLTRATYFNSTSNIFNNGTTYVNFGSVNNNTYWEVNFSSPLIVGTTILTWSPFSLNPNVLFTWNVVTGTSENIVENNGYIPTNVARTTFTLPPTADVGDSFKIMGYGSGGWKIAQNAGQEIHLGSATSQNGVFGYIESTNAFDNLEIVCLVADTVFSCRAVIGNITVF